MNILLSETMGWLTRHTLAQRLTSISGYNEIPGRFPSSFTVEVVFFFASTNPQRTGGQGGGSRGMSFFPLSARRKIKWSSSGGRRPGHGERKIETRYDYPDS